MSKTITLKTPIESSGEVIEKLEFRDITTADYVALGPVMGVVVRKDGTSYVQEFTKVIIGYIVRLTGLTSTDVAKLSLPDFLQVRDHIRDSLDFSTEPDFLQSRTRRSKTLPKSRLSARLLLANPSKGSNGNYASDACSFVARSHGYRP